MKTTSLISLIYGLVLILSGFMEYSFQNRILSLIIEVFGGIIIILSSLYFGEKKIHKYILIGLSLLLCAYYGYNFSKTLYFFQALLTMVSFYIFVRELVMILRITKPE
jgi:hypothetical protein